MLQAFENFVNENKHLPLEVEIKLINEEYSDAKSFLKEWVTNKSHRTFTILKSGIKFTFIQQDKLIK